jgi:hypothetical protein
MKNQKGSHTGLMNIESLLLKPSRVAEADAKQYPREASHQEALLLTPQRETGQVTQGLLQTWSLVLVTCPGLLCGMDTGLWNPANINHLGQGNSAVKPRESAKPIRIINYRRILGKQVAAALLNSSAFPHSSTALRPRDMAAGRTTQYTRRSSTPLWLRHQWRQVMVVIMAFLRCPRCHMVKHKAVLSQLRLRW